MWGFHVKKTIISSNCAIKVQNIPLIGILDEVLGEGLLNFLNYSILN